MGPSQAVKRAEFLVSRLSMVAYSYHEGVILALSSDAIPELDGTPMSASKEAGPETQNDGDGRGPDEGSGVHATRRPAAPSHSAVAGSSAFGRSNTGLSRHGLAKQPLSSLAPIAESRTPPKRQAVSSSIGTGSFSRHFDPWQDESKDKDDDDTVTGAGEVEYNPCLLDVCTFVSYVCYVAEQAAWPRETVWLRLNGKPNQVKQTISFDTSAAWVTFSSPVS
jgi:hypothetical protein